MRSKSETRLPAWMASLRRSECHALLILLCASILAYFSLSNGLPGDFILDDHGRIENVDIENPSLQDVSGAILKTNSGTFGRVLPLASLFMTKALYGNEAEIYKFHNILFHLIAGLLIFWFVARLFASGRFDKINPARSAWLFAAVVSSLWLLHPIQVSTALYVVQRMTQFSLIFTLLTLISYLSVRSALAVDARRAILPLIGMTIFMIAGLLSKETAALIPFYILLIEFFVFRFTVPATRTSRIYYALIGVYCILPIMAGVTYFMTHADIFLHDYIMRPFSLSERIATEAIVMWRYVGMLAIPRLSEFTLYHDGIPINTLLSLKSLLALGFWIVSIGMLVCLRNKAPIAVFGIAFFLVSHLLESTILPLELMFEHRNYIGSIGIMIALASAILYIRNYLPTLRVVSSITIAALVLGFAGMQIARATDWSDHYIYTVVAAREHPESPRAASTLANHQARRGHLDEAKSIIRTAIENRTHDGALPGLYLHLVMFHCHDENLPIELLDNAQQAIENNPIASYSLTGLKVIRQRMIDGDCPAMTRPVLLLLESSAAANERTRLAYRLYFNGMAGVTSAELGHYKPARIYFTTALEYSDHVSRVTHRDTLVALAQVCIAEKNRSCADEALPRAKAANNALEPMIKSHEMMPFLDDMYQKAFSKGKDSANET